MPTPYDPSTPAGQVRLLANDTNADAGYLLTDAEITAFLTMEGGIVKRAAAQAIDTIADNEVLVAKAITDHDLTLDGAKVADSLRKRAAALRAQADVEVQLADDAGNVDIISLNGDPDFEFNGYYW